MVKYGNVFRRFLRCYNLQHASSFSVALQNQLILMTNRQNCRKSSVVECIFEYTALHFECRLTPPELLFSVLVGWVCTLMSLLLVREIREKQKKYYENFSILIYQLPKY